MAQPQVLVRTGGNGDHGGNSLRFLGYLLLDPAQKVTKEAPLRGVEWSEVGAGAVIGGLRFESAEQAPGARAEDLGGLGCVVESGAWRGR